jgi:hypothetical protein
MDASPFAAAMFLAVALMLATRVFLAVRHYRK